MGISGLLTLIAIGALAAGSYYYRNDIKSFLKDNRSDEEKDYDFERKKKEDAEWDNSVWNPDNWGGDNWFANEDNSKTEPKEGTKQIPAFTPIQVIDPQTGNKTITVIPNTRINSESKRTTTTAAGWY